MKQNEIIIKDFLEDGFNLKSHLIEFLKLKPNDLDDFLLNAKLELANIHPGDSLKDCTEFYEQIVGDKHLADLAAWHITSKEYISNTLKLQQKFAGNLILDFGGGIGTHSLANAMSTNVEHVFFVDINKTNRDFVKFRADKLGLDKKISFFNSIEETNIDKFDSIICLDVLEHLFDPASQLKVFYKIMKNNSIAILNWYFYKGENNEYPFHVDDNNTIEKFFNTLQKHFIEVFHPILITTRTYKKLK